ncbi:hypothetical protein [Comamonas composti]|uniref:hypothetical protein n=1 Tax=Comamonas composti TaxID=408558 RepID=UPI0012EBAF38|nr:hypothetical protein [Comamonas composti]
MPNKRLSVVFTITDCVRWFPGSPRHVERPRLILVVNSASTPFSGWIEGIALKAALTAKELRVRFFRQEVDHSFGGIKGVLQAQPFSWGAAVCCGDSLGPIGLSEESGRKQVLPIRQVPSASTRNSSSQVNDLRILEAKGRPDG